MTTLSGRVTDLEKHLLALPTRDEISQLSSLNTSRFNTVIETLTSLSDAVIELQIKLTNIQLNGVSGGMHTHKDNQVPTGTVNGINASFALPETPLAASVVVVKNGITQKPGAGNDYILSSSTITFEAGNVPESGDNILVSYRT